MVNRHTGGLESPKAQTLSKCFVNRHTGGLETAYVGMDNFRAS